MRPLVPALLLFLALPAPAAAQAIKRCTDAQGNTVFTDRPCASVDAVPKGAPPGSGGATAAGIAPRGCARSAEALLLGVRAALEARDVNRLASYYHWAGTGNRGARQLMDELEAIATRPLVAVNLAYPAPEATTGPATGSGSLPGRVQATDAAPGTGSEPDPVLDPALGEPASGARLSGPRPVWLDVEQMAGPADAGSRSTRFRLQRHVGCWWLEL